MRITTFCRVGRTGACLRCSSAKADEGHHYDLVLNTVLDRKPMESL